MRQSISGRNPEDGRSIEVIVEDGRVRDIVQGSTDREGWISPGLIDLQVNGYEGDDVNMDGIDADIIHSLTEKVIATGVTTYLPTIITASEKKITAALWALAEARRRSRLVADAVPYVHVEGPSISPVDGYRGAHAREHVRPPSLAEFARWQHASGDLVGMVTLSHIGKEPKTTSQSYRSPASMSPSDIQTPLQSRFVAQSMLVRGCRHILAMAARE
jgi:N-acetylglucosamine-6-phosphate deacetylase